MSETQPTGAQPDNLHDGQNTAESAFMSGLKELRNDSSKSARDIAEGLSELYGHDDFKSWSNEDLYKFIAEANENQHEQTDGPSAYARFSAEQKADFMKVLTPMVKVFEDRVADSSEEEYKKNREELQDAITREGGITRAEAYALIELARDDIYGVGQDVAPAEKADGAEAEPKADGVPKDADQYKIEELEKDAPAMGWHARAMQKLGLVKGAGFGGNAALFAWQMLGKRAEKQAKKQAKFDAMGPKERKNYLRRNRAIVVLGSLAATVAVVGTKGHLWGIATGGGQQLNHELAGGGTGAGAFREADSVSLEYSDKSYNNSDSSFYDFANKQHHGDHGTPLTVNADHAKDTISGTYNAGFNDWAERGKHEPNGLGNLRVGLGLEGDDTFENRNKVADFLDGNPKIHEARNKETWAALNDSSKFKIETIKIEQPYTTTYMTDVNGDPVIGQQSGVDYGGEAFKITDAKTGKETLWRKDCGGFQQIWLEEKPAPVPTQQYEQASQPVQHNYVPPQGTGGETPVTPGTPETPVTPETPTVPVTPEVPTEPETPVVPPSKPEKDTSLTPDLPGLTADTSETEQTQHPDTAGNGTGSPDATTTTETTPSTTQDTGTGVTVPGAGAETNTGGNTVEPGANAPDGNGGTTPNGTIDPNNV